MPKFNPVVDGQSSYEWLFLDGRRWFFLLFLMSIGLMVTAAVLQYGFGVLPCHMCWWQRYMHALIGVLSLCGVIVPRRWAKASLACLIVMAAGVGLAIAIWQFSAQHKWLPFPPSCTSSGAAAISPGEDLLSAMNAFQVIPCDLETFKLLGLSLAGWNIPTMVLVICIAALGLRSIVSRG